MPVSEPLVFRRITDWFLNCLGERGGVGFIQKHSSKIAGITLAGPVIINGISLAYNHGHKIPSKLREAKVWALEQITPPENLSQREIIQWYGKKTTKVLGATALAGASAASIYALTKLGLFHGAAKGAWNLLNKLSIFRSFVQAFDKPNPSIVYPGYLGIAIAQLYQAKRSYNQNEKLMSIKNIFASAASLLTIGAMMTGVYEARWHHMSYGLLSMLPSSFTLNVFGGLMTLDSMLYWLKPMKDDYDFSNIFVENASLFATQIVGMTAFEWITKRIFSEPPQNL